MLHLSAIRFIFSQPDLCTPCLLASPPARSFSPTGRLCAPALRALFISAPFLSPRCSKSPPIRRNSRIDIRHAHRSYLVHEPLILALIRVLRDLYRWYDILPRLIVAAHLILFCLALSAARVRRQEHVQQCGDRGIRARASHLGAT